MREYSIMERSLRTAPARRRTIPFDSFYHQETYIYGREARLERIRRKRKQRAIRRRLMLAAFFAAFALLLGACLTGFSSVKATKAPSYKYYTAVTVRRDDTLWDIASRYMGEEYPSVKAYIREIKEVNGMKSDAVYYGQKLILPYYSEEEK